MLVFDLGGGTFDVSVLEIGDGVFEVKSTHGDTHLGGDDWDQRVIDWLVKRVQERPGVDLSKDRMAMQRLKEAAEKAKIELVPGAVDQINLPFITATADGPAPPRRDADPRQVPGDDRRPDRALPGPVRAGDQGRRASPRATSTT